MTLRQSIDHLRYLLPQPARERLYEWHPGRARRWQEHAAEQQIAARETQRTAEVLPAMIAVEKASLAFEMMVQVRNKIISAYQEVSRIPF